MDPDLAQGVSDDELGDLARLADGTLPPGRRAEVEARVAASAQLAAIADRQAVALDALRGAADAVAPPRLRARVERRGAADSLAPPRLRARVERRGGAARGAPPERRIPRLGTAVAAAACVALIASLVLSSALSGGPSVADAAAFGQRPPTRGAPRATADAPPLLAAAVDGVPFPNFGVDFVWKAVGARDDTAAGRRVTTVFYADGGRTIAYAIVSGDALDAPPPARRLVRAGVTFRTWREDGHSIVTWERHGHTCVLSGTAVGPAELVTLADWRGGGAITF